MAPRRLSSSSLQVALSRLNGNFLSAVNGQRDIVNQTRDESTVENRAQPNYIQALAAAVAQVQQHYMPAKHPEDIEAHSQLNDAIWQIFSICGSLIGKRAGHQELTPREFAKSIAIALHRFHQRMMMALVVARSRNWFGVLRFGMLRERIL